MTTPVVLAVQKKSSKLKKNKSKEVIQRASALTSLYAESNGYDWWLALARIIVEALEPDDIDNLVTKSLNIERFVLGGNQSSDMYHAEIEFIRKSDGDNEMVYKANLLIKDLYTDLAATCQEYFTHVKLMPIMKEILLKAGVRKVTLAPHLYLARKTESELHVFENMATLGYTVVDQNKGFDFATTKIILEKLAYFHAASMIVQHKHAQLIEQLPDYYGLNDSSCSAFFELIIDKNIKNLAAIVAEWSGYENIAQKLLQNTGDEFKDKFSKMFEKSCCKIHVINHGELWIRNIMVKNSDTEQAEDAVFIDFQNCFIGSPAFDLQSLFATSLEFAVLEQQREVLLRHYFKCLSRTLQQYNKLEPCIELPTFEDLQFEMEYFTFYALVTAFPQRNISITASKLDQHYAESFETAHGPDLQLGAFSNSKILKTLKFILKRLDELGVLE